VRGWIPRPEPELSEAAQQAFEATMKAADQMARRLAEERKGKLTA
jgi:hypothetical protein